MSVFNAVVLDIEQELLIMDNMINTYKPIDNTLLLFNNKERFPITKGSFYSEFLNKTKNKDVSTTSSYGWRCVNFVNEMVTNHIYVSKKLEDYTDYYKNRLIPKSNVCRVFYDPVEDYISDIWDVFFKYFEFIPNSKRDISMFLMALDSIYRKVSMYTDLYINNIFHLDFSSVNVILYNDGEIGSYRYKEYLELIRINNGK